MNQRNRQREWREVEGERQRHSLREIEKEGMEGEKSEWLCL